MQLKQIELSRCPNYSDSEGGGGVGGRTARIMEHIIINNNGLS